MLQFSLKTLFLVTACAALCVVVVTNASPSIAIACNGTLLAVATAAVILATRTQDAIVGAGYVGAAVSVAGTCLASMQFQTPAQLYLCPPAFGVAAFSTVPGLWDTFSALVAVPMGFVGYAVGRWLRASNLADASISLLTYNRVWFILTLTAVVFATGLIALRSAAIATLSQTAANAVFLVAVIASIYRHAARRIFWIALAATIWTYLFLETIAVWPYSYYLGPAPYLYRHYNSVSSSWVTAHCLFAILLAAHVGFLAQWIAVRLVSRRAQVMRSASATNDDRSKCATEPSDAAKREMAWRKW